MPTQRDLDEILGWFDEGVERPSMQTLEKLADAWGKRRVSPQISAELAGGGRCYQRTVTADGQLIAVLNTVRPLTDQEAAASVGSVFRNWAWNNFRVRFSSLD